MTVKVLQVVTILDRGGEETMIMNYYRSMNRDEIQFDFLVHRDDIGVYEEEIKNMGGKIYRAFPIRPWNYRKYRAWLKEFFEEHKDEYEAVHAHILENCGFVLDAAKEAGVPVRIAHSHSNYTKRDYKYIFRMYGKYILKKSSATHLLACGEEAGKYLFDDRNFLVLPNAVDTSKFAFSPEIRRKIRGELKITDEFVIGNVARFHPVKNQSYLVDIFAAYLKRNPNSILILVGIGEEQDNVREKVHELELDSKVRFLNLRTDIEKLLQAFDMIVFPSKLEGLPLSLIEAQAAGLPCLLSDHVAKETAITDLVEFEALNHTPEQWGAAIENKMRGFVRLDTTEKIKRAGYDIAVNTEILRKIYLNEE